MGDLDQFERMRASNQVRALRRCRTQVMEDCIVAAGIENGLVDGVEVAEAS